MVDTSVHRFAPKVQAAVFDLDGVLTRTARVHFVAWKSVFDAFLRERAARLGEAGPPFSEEDYRNHVDGRPRREGIRAFLAARGIEVAEDGGEDSVTALAERKNEAFGRALERDGVDVDEGMVRFARELRARGVPVAVATSSRNGARVLRRAGLDDLADARVDGETLAELGLRGKPAPDLFLAALERLGRPDPRAALLVEDAASGVAAGRAAGFGLVIGIDRGGRHLSLREHGADWIVGDGAALTPERIDEIFSRAADVRPNPLADWRRFLDAVAGRRIAVFLDYDGTLTPIVERPELAVLSAGMRDRLGALARACPTCIVSGRGLDDVRALVGVESIAYAGSHGFDIAGPDIRREMDAALVPRMTRACERLRESIGGLAGVAIEDKRFAVAVHYRRAAEADVPRIERAIDELVARDPELRKTLGKKVFEVRPAIEWDKGRAVLWLIEALGVGGDDLCPIYVGDDVTDEDAFAAIATSGIGVLVSEVPVPSSARFTVQDVEEVEELLRRLTALARGTA